MLKKRTKELPVSIAAMVFSRELQILKSLNYCNSFEKGTFINPKLFVSFSIDPSKCMAVILSKGSQSTEYLI